MGTERLAVMAKTNGCSWLFGVVNRFESLLLSSDTVYHPPSWQSSGKHAPSCSFRSFSTLSPSPATFPWAKKLSLVSNHPPPTRASPLHTPALLPTIHAPSSRLHLPPTPQSTPISPFSSSTETSPIFPYAILALSSASRSSCPSQIISVSFPLVSFCSLSLTLSFPVGHNGYDLSPARFLSPILTLAMQDDSICSLPQSAG